MPVVTIKELLEAGAHFGHETYRWHPKMNQYIYKSKDGIYIVDLKKTLEKFVEAYNFLRKTISGGGSILFVGTKKQARDIITEQSQRCGEHYVSYRWLGGTLTNFSTIRKSVNKLVKLEESIENNILTSYVKKEALTITRRRDRMNRVFSGLKAMTSLPSALFVVDARKESVAISEARKLGIDVIAMVDTNTDPNLVTYPIPCNDDAIKSIQLFVSKMADAVLEGKHFRQVKNQELEEQKIGRGEALSAVDSRVN